MPHNTQPIELQFLQQSLDDPEWFINNKVIAVLRDTSIICAGLLAIIHTETEIELKTRRCPECMSGKQNE